LQRKVPGAAMLSMLVGVNTLLLAVILAVLVHHISKDEWIAIVNKSRIFRWRAPWSC
jgi:hypothetical protein